jgi:hypothetical protein
MTGLFRSKNPALDRRAPVTAAVLADLEQQADAAELGFRWVPLNRAGDLCDRAGDRPKALAYYGRAIDAMLEDGQPEPARGLATKIVRIHPAAVRTLCTLTWLDLASHHMASVVVHLNEYVVRAHDAERGDLAGEQIYMMAHVASEKDFRLVAADALDALGCPDDANEVRGWVAAGEAPHDADAPADWTDRCLGHALGSNARRVAPPEEGLDEMEKEEEEAQVAVAPEEKGTDADTETDEADEDDSGVMKDLRKRDPKTKWI